MKRLKIIGILCLIVYFIYIQAIVLKSIKQKDEIEIKHNLQIDSLTNIIYMDSLIINQCIEEQKFCDDDLKETQRENQIFSSMLSEIENSPEGHNLLKKIWGESND